MKIETYKVGSPDKSSKKYEWRISSLEVSYGYLCRKTKPVELSIGTQLEKRVSGERERERLNQTKQEL